MDTVRECTRIWRPFGTRWSNALKLNVKISTVPTDQHITTQAPQSLGETLRAWIKEFIQFGLVGATAFVIDMGLFNLFQHGPLGFLSGHVNTANALAASIATIYSWIMNRVWTYRGRTQENAGREAFRRLRAGNGFPLRFLSLRRIHGNKKQVIFAIYSSLALRVPPLWAVESKGERENSQAH